MIGLKRLLFFLLPLSACIGLAACSAFHGGPDPVISVQAERKDLTTYLTGDILQKYYAADNSARGGLTQQAWRDAVISARLEIADQNFRDFKYQLYMQTTAVNLGVDLAALGLSGAAAVATGGTAQALSAANTGVIGAGTAFNKETLFARTLPAIVAQMEANRSAVLLRIRSAQALADANKYPLSSALTDISSYEGAGTLMSAIQSLTTAAQNEANTNKLKVDAITGLTILPPDVQARRDKFSNYIADLVSKNDKVTLDKIVDALNTALKLSIAKNSNVRTEGVSVLEAIIPYVNGGAAAEKMTTVSDALKSITNDTF